MKLTDQVSRQVDLLVHHVCWVIYNITITSLCHHLRTFSSVLQSHTCMLTLTYTVLTAILKTCEPVHHLKNKRVKICHTLPHTSLPSLPQTSPFSLQSNLANCTDKMRPSTFSYKTESMVTRWRRGGTIKTTGDNSADGE